MKRVFWLMSAVGLTFAQTGAAQTPQSNQDAYVASVPDTDIDSLINNLISKGNQSAPVTARIAPAPAVQAPRQNFSSSYISSSRQSSGFKAQLTSNSAPSIAAQFASRAARGKSVGLCAMYVRRALQAAGYTFTPQASAYMYANGTLASAGFTKISSTNYQPQVGDVAVFNRTSRNPHGHIQIYDGSQWASDYRQSKFSPYSQHNGYTVWRDANYVDASSNTGTTLAFNQ